jgi:hypothetical protein
MSGSSFEDLISFEISSIKTVLRRYLSPLFPGAAELLANAAKPALEESTLLQSVLDIFCEPLGMLLNDAPALCSEITRLLSLTGPLLEDRVAGTTLQEAADAAHGLGEQFDKLGEADMAYNLFDSAYYIYDIIRHPCLTTANALRRLSHPDNLNQHYSAIWRYATQALVQALNTSSAWLEAIDAAELALTVYTPDEGLQQKLCKDFSAAMANAQDTPLNALPEIYVANIDPRFISPEIRLPAITELAKRQWPPNQPWPVGRAIEIYATFNAQCSIDDTRQHLIGLSKDLPSLGWNDLTLRHPKLVNAVPLRRSLIVNVNRTGEFAMQIAHEITHAYCLTGPLGWASAAYGAAIQSHEQILKRRGATADTLPTDTVSLALGEVQLLAALRAAVQESVWTPWLEGVAQYVELLADPTENSKQIITVHAALRSLVDPLQEEGKTFKECFEAMAAQFDRFMSEAISRLSRLRHIGYYEPGFGMLRDVYLLGYLMVRSVVCRWEVTLGRRITPVDAASALVLITRHATSSVDWGFDVPPESIVGQSMDEFARWVRLMSSMNRESLEMLLESPEKDSAGYEYYWIEGRPVRTAEPLTESELSVAQEAWKHTEKGALAVLFGPGILDSLAEKQRSEAYSLLINGRSLLIRMLGEFVNDRALLPVGRDMARLIPQSDGTIIISPRTYVGLGRKGDDAGLPRYSPRSVRLEKGKEEAEFLRKLSGYLGTSRAVVTRVVDLVGHPETPLQYGPISYVWIIHGSAWNRVTLGDHQKPVDVSDGFLQSVRRRLRSSGADSEEASRLESLSSLAKRLPIRNEGYPWRSFAETFDKLATGRSIAVEVLSASWEAAEGALSKALDEVFEDPGLRNGLADYLYRTGRSEPWTGDHPVLATSLARLAFRRDVGSGIRPFGEGE